MNVELWIGREAEKRIAAAEFRQQWKTLYSKCPWATVFQSDDFIVTWYETYRSQFTPVLVTARNTELAGLFTLAIDNESGQLVVAGTSEAEYHAWLSAPPDGNAFITAALDKLRAQFPHQTLTLLFVLPTVPLEWTAPDNRWGKHCYLNTLPRGFMEIGDGARFQDTLRKKKQSKINRLKRLGHLHLDRIENPEELGAIFDEIISYQTLRLRAIQNLTHVDEDPLKKTFYMNLLRLPRMLHATALRVDDKLISAQIHNYNHEQVRLGLITHSPFYAKYSPGELHLLMMGVELAKDEIALFDLTPGGQYKDRYATRHDEVFAVKVFFQRAHCTRYKIKRRLVALGKAALERFDITPEQTKDAFSTFVDWQQKWRRLKPTDLFVASVRSLKRKLRYTDELCVFACDLKPFRHVPDTQPMQRDSLPDLLTYQPTASWQLPVNQFLKQALDKLEAGQRLYTRCEDGKLLQYGWLLEPQEKKPASEEIPGLLLPPDAVLLSDFYTSVQDQSLSRAALTQMLHDAARVPGATQAYLCLAARNEHLRAVVTALGFTPQYSLFHQNVLGRVTNWSTALEA
jgi:CelD/BcsL family acetyltransferase involved in cellulose biosynthesis